MVEEKILIEVSTEDLKFMECASSRYCIENGIARQISYTKYNNEFDLYKALYNIRDPKDINTEFNLKDLKKSVSKYDIRSLDLKIITAKEIEQKDLKLFYINGRLCGRICDIIKQINSEDSLAKYKKLDTINIWLAFIVFCGLLTYLFLSIRSLLF